MMNFLHLNIDGGVISQLNQPKGTSACSDYISYYIFYKNSIKILIVVNIWNCLF